MQFPAVPDQLRRVGVVGVVSMFGHVRWWHSAGQPHSQDRLGPWRLGMPRVDADPIVQHASMSGGLRGQWLVGMVDLLGQVWRWCGDTDSYHFDRGSPRRCAVPRLVAL